MKWTKSGGFSLVELLVATAIGAVILLVAGNLFTSSHKGFKAVQRGSELEMELAVLSSFFTVRVKEAQSVAIGANSNTLNLTLIRDSSLATKTFSFQTQCRDVAKSVTAKIASRFREAINQKIKEVGSSAHCPAIPACGGLKVPVLYARDHATNKAFNFPKASALSNPKTVVSYRACFSVTSVNGISLASMRIFSAYLEQDAIKVAMRDVQIAPYANFFDSSLISNLNY